MNAPSVESQNWAEMCAVLLSKELRDGEVGSPGGARSEIALAAARLAQETHAPNLGLITSAVGYVSNNRGRPPAPLRSLTTDYRNIYAGTEAILGIESVFRTTRDWFFAGGLQVDRFGNLNLSAIGDWDAPRFRGPGAAGLAYCSICAKRYYIYLNEHSPRTLVEQVDFVTAIGHGSGSRSREQLGLTTTGPKLAVTPMAVLDFETPDKRMRLRSVHPWFTPQEVIEATGFELNVPERVPTTPLATEEELLILRERVDPDGVLRKR